MREAQIVERLSRACGIPELVFQVTQQRAKFSIVINHPPTVQPVHEALIAAIETEIATHIKPDCVGFWVSTRVLGQVDIAWQTYVPLHSVAQPSTLGKATPSPSPGLPRAKEPPAAVSPASPMAASTPAPVLDIKTAPVMVGDRRRERPSPTAAEQKFAVTKTVVLPEGAEMTTDETAVLPPNLSGAAETISVEQKTDGEPGVTHSHKRTAQATQVELGSEPSADRNAEALPLDSVHESDLDEGLPRELSAFCFIKNKALLRSDILPPSEAIAVLIADFHRLAPPEQQRLLATLDAVFRATTNRPHHIPPDRFSGQTRDWFERLIALTAAEVRKVAIWISRYCHAPDKTIDELQVVLNPAAAHSVVQAAEEERPVCEPQSSVDRVTPGPNRPFAPDVRRRQIQAAEAKTAKKKAAANLRYLALMVVWMIVICGVVVWQARAPIDNGAIADYCQEVSPAQDACQLTVQLVGQDSLEGVQAKATAVSADMEYLMQKTCELTGNMNAGLTLRQLNRNSYDALSLSGEEVLSGIYLAQVEQNNYGAGGENDPAPGQTRVRTACIYANTGIGPQDLASAILPLNWPEEPFAGKSWPMAITRAEQAYGTFVSFGAKTLFTAIGLFIAAFAGLGLRFRTMNGIVLSAFILQTVEFILTLVIPFQLILMGIAQMVLALLITSQCVKQFEIDWSGGYRMVASGALVVIFLRFVLDRGLFFLIVQMVL